MMHESGQSDSVVVPEKFANKVGPNSTAAEQMEGSTLTKGNETQQNTHQTQRWESVQSKLQLVHQGAKADKKRRFTALLHHIYNIDTLQAAYFKIKKNAAPGVDKETWLSYGENLEGNLQNLSKRLKQGAYRANPVRRVHGSINHEWLVKFIEHRIADKRVVRLIQKWLSAGVLEDGQVTYDEVGAPQGASASPLLSNVYLHYVYDLWVQQWRKKNAHRDLIVVRFADDTIVGFQNNTFSKTVVFGNV